MFAAETGFIIERDPDTVRAPDCAFVRAERLPTSIPDEYLLLAPDLVVETVSPGDQPAAVQRKVAMWIEAGVRLVWVVSPTSRTVTVHSAATVPRLFREDDLLEGEDVVPGFRLEVAEIFE